MTEQPKLHMHVTLSDKDLKVYGGHLKAGEVAGTLEIVVLPLEKMDRGRDEATGLDLLSL
jgi:predicted DNA-binding protein with PD1-like motif